MNDQKRHLQSLAIALFWIAVSVAVISVPGLIKWHLPLWMQSSQQRYQALLCLLGIVPGVLVRSALRRSGTVRRPLLWGLGVTALAFGSIIVLSPKVNLVATSRQVPLIALALSTIALVASASGAHTVQKSLAAIAVAATSIGLGAFAAKQATRRTVLDTHYFDITITPLHIGELRFPGGALAAVGRRVVLAASDGKLYLIQAANDSALSVRRLASAVPVQSTTVPLRVTGLVFRHDGARGTVFASLDRWDPVERCLATSVVMSHFPWRDAPNLDSLDSWSEIYRTRPCLTVRGSYNVNATGGRLQLMPGGQLLLTTGDRDLADKKHQAPQLAQDSASDYGKTLQLSDTTPGTRRIFTSGHRNPQGLLTHSDGAIYETEHGPRGGDEINTLERGRNYGWPLATYGVEYGEHEWPLAPDARDHGTYVEPLLAFTPSIGISNVIEARSKHRQAWAGDLLVASLGAMTLFRVRLTRGRVVYSEPILVQHRIRDLAELPETAHLLLWTDDGYLLDLTSSPRRPTRPSTTTTSTRDDF